MAQGEGIERAASELWVSRSEFSWHAHGAAILVHAIVHDDDVHSRLSWVANCEPKEYTFGERRVYSDRFPSSILVA